MSIARAASPLFRASLYRDGCVVEDKSVQKSNEQWARLRSFCVAAFHSETRLIIRLREINRCCTNTSSLEPEIDPNDHRVQACNNVSAFITPARHPHHDPNNSHTDIHPMVIHMYVADPQIIIMPNIQSNPPKLASAPAKDPTPVSPLSRCRASRHA
jgi:hypothetical protein